MRSTWDREKLYIRAIRKYGQSAQINIAIEEMAELTKELCKHFRSGHNLEAIIEEVADVFIMLEQLRCIFNAPEMFERYVEYKLSRLEKRMEGLK